MTVFVSDTFTDSDNTPVTSHTGETGASWTQHPSYSATVPHINGNRLRGASSSDACVYASGTPASAEYDVESALFINGGSASAAWGICGRLSTSANTMYLLQYASGAGAWRLFKGVGGSFTLLGTYTQSLSVSTEYATKLEIRDASKKVYIDSVERISSGDNAVTAAGRVGVRHNGSSLTASQYPSITGTDLSGGGSSVSPLAFMHLQKLSRA